MEWAPKSPDLSSYYSPAEQDHPVSLHPQHQGYRGSISSPIAYNRSLPPQNQQQQQQFMPRVPRDESMQDPDYIPHGSIPMNIAPAATSTLPPGLENINIKNHFPVARIKRIMQADDDVGKVAQVTPVVVSKALELFMISLVTKAAAEAKSRNSKRVGAIHLKHAITKNEQFDFLNDIVSKVAEAPEKSDADAGDTDGRKKKPAARKKKKAQDDDDDF